MLGISTTAVIPPYAEPRMAILTPCLAASCPAMNRPSCSLPDKSSSGGSLSLEFVSAICLSVIPSPRSSISTIRPLATLSLSNLTGVLVGENVVAFSTISASM